MQALFYVFPREILLQFLHVEIAAGLELRARAEDADDAFVQRPADLRAAGGKLLKDKTLLVKLVSKLVYQLKFLP